MSGYAISDVRAVLREREWDNWAELLLWLEQQEPDAQGGMSERDRDELARDLRKLEERGTPFSQDVSEIYQELATVRE
jgi:hypothetical protein